MSQSVTNSELTGSTDNFQYSFKFVFVGDSYVGKTSIVNRFCSQSFSSDQKETIALEFGTKTIEIDGAKIKLQIWDTAGQERFRSITRAYFRSSAAVFLVYDVTNRDSFSHLDQWVEDASSYSPASAIKVIIGNKTDLQENRAVSEAEAKDFCIQNGIEYFETSALSGDRINDAFIETARRVYAKLREGQNVPDTPSPLPIVIPDSDQKGCC